MALCTVQRRLFSHLCRFPAQTVVSGTENSLLRGASEGLASCQSHFPVDDRAFEFLPSAKVLALGTQTETTMCQGIGKCIPSELTASAPYTKIPSRSHTGSDAQLSEPQCCMERAPLAHERVIIFTAGCKHEQFHCAERFFQQGFIDKEAEHPQTVLSRGSGSATLVSTRVCALTLSGVFNNLEHHEL